MTRSGLARSIESAAVIVDYGNPERSQIGCPGIRVRIGAEARDAFVVGELRQTAHTDPPIPTKNRLPRHLFRYSVEIEMSCPVIEERCHRVSF